MIIREIIPIIKNNFRAPISVERIVAFDKSISIFSLFFMLLFYHFRINRDVIGKYLRENFRVLNQLFLLLQTQISPMEVQDVQ